MHVQWQARWIRPASWTREPNQYFYARRTINLTDPVESATLHISADTTYRLHVNGRYVGWGPPRSVINWKTFDTYSVADLLSKGTNVIAVEVNSIHPHGIALICQLEMAPVGQEEPVIVGTDVTWAVRSATPWETRAIRNTWWNFTEVYDARREPLGWMDPGYDEAGWERAHVLQHMSLWLERGRGRSGVPIPHHTHVPPYYRLEPRDIPILQETPVLPSAIANVGEVDVLSSWGMAQVRDVGLQMLSDTLLPLERCSCEGTGSLLSGDGPVVIDNEQSFTSVGAFYEALDGPGDVPTVRNVTLILDLGRILNGTLEIDVEGAAGSIVDLAYGQVLDASSRVMAKPIESASNAGRYVLREGRQRWRSYHWVNVRYLQLTFRELRRPLLLHSVRAIEVAYPAPERGRFHCSDPFFGELWDATTRTVRICLTDNYMDNTVREKNIWSGDPAQVMLGSLAAFGDTAVNARYLRTLARHQSHVGFFPDVVNSNVWGHIENPVKLFFGHDLYFCLIYCAYHQHGGDPELVSELYPHFSRYLRSIEYYVNGDGLLENVPYGGHWIDWAHVDLRGASLIYNLFYYGILTQIASIAEDVGAAGDADRYRELAGRMPGAIDRLFWDETRGLYVDGLVDGERSPRYSEHGNYLALLHGVPGAERKAILLQNLDPLAEDVVQVEPSFMLYPLQALFAVGEPRRALDMMRHRYRRFARVQPMTLWEEWSYRMSMRWGDWYARFRSLAQASGCIPSFVLLTEVLGVRPIEPGYTHFSVRPQLGDLAWAEGVVPAPVGQIVVRCERGDEGLCLRVGVPHGAVADVHLPACGVHTVNGRAIDEVADLEVHTCGESTIYAVPAGVYVFAVRDVDP